MTITAPTQPAPTSTINTTLDGIRHNVKTALAVGVPPELLAETLRAELARVECAG